MNRSKQVLLNEIYDRYRQATRADKGKILDEFCAMCSYHRKHATRILNQKRYKRRKVKVKRQGRHQRTKEKVY